MEAHDARDALRPAGPWTPIGETLIGSSIPARFARIAREHAARPALDDGREVLTYAALEARTAAIGAAAAGTRPMTIALLLGQGATFVQGLVGATRTGAGVAPLDPAYPDTVLVGLLERAGATVIVADAATSAMAQRIAGGRTVVEVDRLDPDSDPAWRDPAIAPDAPASLFMTSGSTGTPKGVVDTQASVLDNVRRYVDSLAIGPDDRLSLIHGPMFSGLQSSLWSALLTGATILPFDVRSAGLDRLATFIGVSGMTMVHCVPSVFRGLTHTDRTFPSLRVVRLEGDLADWSDVERFRRATGPEAVLVNGLGATETGLTRQFFVGQMSPPLGVGALPVGYPVDGVTVDIVGADGQPRPPGEEGELVVRGRGLAAGYRDDPDRTARAFAPDPADAESRVYRTGDLGRMDPDGCLHHLGRLDDVHKIRGQVIDPTILEGALRSRPNVAAAAAITRRDVTGEARLLAYVVGDDARIALDPVTLRRSVANELPDALVPAAIMVLAGVPLTSANKVDRAALPDPGHERPRLSVAYAPPRDPLEDLLVDAWADVLGIRPVGIDDPFFDLGGDSLAATTMLLEVGTRLGTEIPVGAMARAATVAELAGELRRRRGAGDTSDGSDLVTLADGSERSVFVIHAAPDQPWFLRDVARGMGMGIAFHSLPPLDPHDPAAASVESMADRYLDRIRTVQPEGPYHLAGVCFGALVAHAAARRLVARGEEVGSLSLIAISPLEFPTLIRPTAVRRYRRDRLRRRVAAILDAGRREGGREAVALATAGLLRLMARERFRRTTGRVPDRVGAAPDLAAQHAALVARHVAAPYPGPITAVLGASARPAFFRGPDELADLSTARVEVVVLPGDDHDIVAAPTAERVAAVLRAVSEPDRDVPDPAVPDRVAGHPVP